MNSIQKYLAYLKNNPERYWFKRKIWGWGWTPARWQGWAVIAVFLVIVVVSGLEMSTRAEVGEPTTAELEWFSARIFFAVIALIVICYKTGEKPRWMWGFPD